MIIISVLKTTRFNNAELSFPLVVLAELFVLFCWGFLFCFFFSLMVLTVFEGYTFKAMWRRNSWDAK